MERRAQFLIAAPHSGSGKTTVARGLMALWADAGLRVQPFKCGPDYIDTKFHEAVCGRPSVNLDTFMASPEHVTALFAHYAADADVCVVEGMMGLFDGYDRDRGSSAEVAALLGLPIVLVVDARSAAYSLAPLLQGFMHFRPDVHLAGVIYNKVGSVRHQEVLQRISDDVGLPCLGMLPRTSTLEQESRYLGLDFSATVDVAPLKDFLRDHIDLPQLLRLTTNEHTVTRPVHSLCTEWAQGSEPLLFAVARNAESFTFLYQEHLDMLRRLGQVVFFDPEKDEALPEGTSMLYLPGGYPEKHAEALSAARTARESIRAYVAGGGRVLAECGGMMYLCQNIVTDEGEWPMAGVLPCKVTARPSDRRLSLGYRSLELAGLPLRGHEFHYTQLLPPIPPSATQVFDAHGRAVTTPVFRVKNVIASYTHLYWGGHHPLSFFD